MPGPKYNYLNVRDELHIISGCIKLADGDMMISSSADGQLDIISDTTAKVTSPTVELEGSTGVTLDGDVTIDTGHTLTCPSDVTVAGDLTRRSVVYMSANATWTLPTGYTRITDYMTIPDEGVVFLSGISGSITGKLSTSVLGKNVHLVFTDSGNASNGQTNAQISGSFGQYRADNTNRGYFLKFTKPGETASVTGDGSNWYFISPVSGCANFLSSYGPTLYTSKQ